MRKVFPLSFKGKGFKAVILSTLIYTLIVLAVSILIGIFDLPSGIGIAINILKQIVLLYCVSGIVVSVLHAADIVK